MTNRPPKQSALDREMHAHIARIEQTRRILGHRPRRSLRLGCKQHARIGVLRGREHVPDAPGLYQSTVLHDADTIGKAPNNREIVRDEQERETARAFEVGQKLEDLRLDGDIERRGRLVGN